ncbi:MAG: hypothetical protein Q4B28_04710 [bacterium]|nr:hypothetical protein [bacterium]
MEDYLGLGLNAASFLNAKTLTPDCCALLGVKPSEDITGLRFKNTPHFEQYLTGKTLDPFAFEQLSTQDYLIESFFLGLRTDQGVSDLSHYASILVPQYQSKLENYKTQGLIYDHPHKLVLTDEGMDVFNAIVTDIMQQI